MATVIDTAHPVGENQFEPQVPLEEQAHFHVLEMDLLDLTLVARVGLTARIGLELDVPYREVRTDASFRGAEGELLEDFESIHHRTETVSGFADLRLTGRFRLRLPEEGEEGWIVDALGGISLPTGDTERDPFVLGEAGHEHQHIFFGTGTFDPIVGLEAYRARGDLQLAGWLRLRTSLYENSSGYQAGTQVSAGLGVNPAFGLKSWSFIAQLEAYHEEPSRWDDRDARNSGRTDLVGNLGVSWAPVPHWNLHASVKFPNNLAAKGGQLELSPMITLGVTRTLHSRRTSEDR
jgi:hypothetical protein